MVEQPTPSKQQVEGRILLTTAETNTAEGFWLRRTFKSRSNRGNRTMVEDKVSCKIK